MAATKIIIKRRGHREEYDNKKVYASAYAAVLNCHETEMKAEDVAKKVVKEVDKWIAKQQFVESSDIKKQLTVELSKFHEDYALMYRTHLDLS